MKKKTFYSKFQKAVKPLSIQIYTYNVMAITTSVYESDSVSTTDRINPGPAEPGYALLLQKV